MPKKKSSHEIPNYANFSITQNDCHHTEFYPCVSCVTTKIKQLTRQVYEKCCHQLRRIYLSKVNVINGTEQKLAKRNMRHAEKKYRLDKTNKLEHNEFRQLLQLKCG